MQEGSVTFEPVRPPPLKPWQAGVGLVLFVVLIAFIVWKMRSRSDKPPGSLR